MSSSRPQRRSPGSSPDGRGGARSRSGLRAGVERRSISPLTWLSSRPRWLPLLVVLVLLLGTALLPPALGVLCLLLLVGLAGWLTYLSWPVLSPGARAARLVVLAMIVVLVAMRLP